jgi:hypothetical protein
MERPREAGEIVPAIRGQKRKKRESAFESSVKCHCTDASRTTALFIVAYTTIRDVAIQFIFGKSILTRRVSSLRGDHG